jgi:cytoskeletal protein RodZ
MNVLQRLMGAGVAIAFFLSSTGRVAADPAKDVKTPPAKVQPKSQPAPQPSSRAFQQAAAIGGQKPAGAGNVNSMRPNQQTKNAAASGWDTPARSKGTVQAPPSKRADPKVISQQENAKLKKEQQDLAKKYPATGKAPPAPAKQNAQPTRSVLSRLFGSKS